MTTMGTVSETLIVTATPAGRATASLVNGTAASTPAL
jgi:hypothetical protein